MDIINLNDVIRHNDFIFAVSTFLDEFKRNINRQKMIECPPQIEGVKREYLCLLAGVAHKLANEYGIAVPDWVHDSQFRMPYPTFSTRNKEYQEFLLLDTPYEFSSKNIYIGSNAIDRV